MFTWNKYWINWKNDSQKQRMKKVLYYYQGKEVSVWRLINDTKICHYTAIIKLLRDDGYNIENRVEYKNKVMHSWYKLII